MGQALHVFFLEIDFAPKQISEPTRSTASANQAKPMFEGEAA
jgi:hypothetical protein